MDNDWAVEIFEGLNRRIHETGSGEIKKAREKETAVRVQKEEAQSCAQRVIRTTAGGLV